MTFPQFDPVLVHIGPIAVRWYALAYVAGIMLGWRYCVGLVRDARLWRGTAPTATGPQIDDFVLWVTLGIIAGGRIGYILFYMVPQDGAALAKDPLAALRIWEGGMSFHGGLIGVTLAIAGFAAANRIDILRLADLTAPCVPFGLFFGRVANFINGELWGRPTTLPWGMVFPHAGPEPRHPSQLYEATLEGVVLFLALRWLTHGRRLLPRRGASTGLFLLLYGLSRIALENVREPDRGMPAFPLGLTMGMMLSAPLLLAGLALLWASSRPGALAAPAPAAPLASPSTAHPPEAASDLFPATESEVADPFRPSPPPASGMSLRDRLEALIAAEGPLTVAQWMDACLHDAEGGYYATRPALGADGDFVTAPGVSQMFGELLGLWSVAAWMALGGPDRVRWVELGPGQGTLIADASRAAARAAPAFVAAAEIVLVETSSPLRERQREALGSAPPVWVDRLDEVEGGAPLVVLANEFLDCLPARQFVRTGAGWAERRVGLAEAGGFRFGLAPPPGDFRPPPWAADAAEGAVLELSPAQARLGAELGARLARDGGAALLIDYGRAAPGFGDTLQALRRHAKVDPLADPGGADLTVHADFPAVAAAARAAGAAASRVLTQSELLQRLGIAARAEALARARPDRAGLIGRQLRRLLAPGEMGELFKALALTSPGLEPPGFEA